jgi:peptide deformylase
MDILKYPDHRLTAPNSKIVRFGAEERELIKEMIKLLEERHGAGLAAPQIGWNARLFVMEAKPEPMILWNPAVQGNGSVIIKSEGCMSLPGIWADVPRRNRVRLTAETVEGKKEFDLEGLDARIVQHEVDHLNGILFIDRLDPAERARIEPEVQALKISSARGGT